MGTDRCDQVNCFSIGRCGLGLPFCAIGYEFQSLSEPDPVLPLIIQHHTYDYEVVRCRNLERLPSRLLLNLQ